MRGDSTPLCLVTGAAGSIGRATVRALRARGLAVASADRSPLATAEADLVVDHLDVDLRDDAAVGRAVSGLAASGALTHLIAVAGGGDAEELAQFDQATEPVEVFTRAVTENLTTAFVTIRHAVPLMREGGGNRSITLTGSINAFGGYGAPGYSSAKAGLAGLANSLAPPLGAEGIRINCLALGTVDTENLHALAAARGDNLDLTAIAARAPLRRVLTPAEVADALVAMALDMPGLTGSTVVLDNGQTLIR